MNSGVIKHENKGNDLIVTFDDEKTSLKNILEELKKGQFNIQGKPVYLK